MRLTSLCFFLVLIVLINFMNKVDAAPRKRSLRLCSKNLSDALYLMCKDRGYNEPSTYSDEGSYSRNGPGLASECCHKSCTYEQLEQYCKPINDSGDSGIEESLRIVNLPCTKAHESSTGEEISLEKKESSKSKVQYTRQPGLESDIELRGDISNNWRDEMTHQSRVHLDQRKSMRCGILVGKSARNDCQVRRRRRRRRGKILLSALMDLRPYKVGTTPPEPSDSVLAFPSKPYRNFRHITKQNFTIQNLQNIPFKSSINKQKIKDNIPNTKRILFF